LIMQYNYIRYRVDQSVGVITLNRPDVLNSFSRPMAKETQDALAKCGDDERVRAILITGEGRGFSAGQDLAEAIPPDGSPAPEISGIVRESYYPIVKLIRSIEKPIVAGVNGVAAGAGANIALACDFVIASENASFIQAFCKIGLIPDSGGTYYLPRLVGLPRATAMMMLGEKISAQDAFQMGMIYKVYLEDSFQDEMMKFAQHLAKQATKALGITKRALNQSFENDLESQLKTEEKLQKEAGQTSDYNEGVKAFREKRKPKFRGK
jgi:2-(1,2-epoxy-1,2-dihydrophenyl)acetyl-CoA isomerase